MHYPIVYLLQTEIAVTNIGYVYIGKHGESSNIKGKFSLQRNRRIN